VSEKYNYNEFTPTSTVAVYTTYRTGNTFTPTASYDLDYIIIKGSRLGNCGDVDLDIYEADVAHKPTGGSLANVQIAQGDISTDAHTEITFTLTAALSLTVGQEYAYVIKSAGANVTNSFLYSRKIVAQSDYYLYSNDGGGTWLTGQIISSWFQAWGTGDTKVDTPSPADAAVGQQTGGVDLSWNDDNPGDSYDIYFGPTGSMVLIASGHGEVTYSYTAALTFEQEYSWKVDINIGGGVVTGDVWTFTVEGFLPPSTNLSSIKRLIVASNNELWYESV